MSRSIGRPPGTQHRPFIDRHIERLSLPKDFTSELPALGFQLLARPQQCGVTGQMQHGRAPYTPRVHHAWLLVAQNWHATVDSPGQFCSTCCPEHRPGASVGIEQCDVVSLERHVARGIVQFVELAYTPYHISHRLWIVQTNQGEQAQGPSTRQMWHEARVVDDCVQTDDSALCEQRLEEGCLGCDKLRRYEAADTPGGTYQEPRSFEEEYGRL